MPKQKNEEMDLITAVVRHSLADETLQAAIKAQAPGITFFSAQGTGVKESMGYIGSLIEHEKKVLWIVVRRKHTEKILQALVAAANLNLPGEGFAYVQPVTQTVGFVEPPKNSKR